MSMRIAMHYDIAPMHVIGTVSGLSRICFDASVFGWLFLFALPVPDTWLLPVAGTTYKPVVIKVFDLLWFPVEAHISRLANTVLLPLWSMDDDKARATKWQCRDWTWGRQWNGRVEGSNRGMQQLHFGMLIWRHIYSYLSVHSSDWKKK